MGCVWMCYDLCMCVCVCQLIIDHISTWLSFHNTWFIVYHDTIYLDVKFLMLIRHYYTTQVYELNENLIIMMLALVCMFICDTISCSNVLNYKYKNQVESMPKKISKTRLILCAKEVFLSHCCVIIISLKMNIICVRVCECVYLASTFNYLFRILVFESN
jgi:hypothetical protein